MTSRGWRRLGLRFLSGIRREGGLVPSGEPFHRSSHCQGRSYRRTNLPAATAQSAVPFRKAVAPVSLIPGRGKDVAGVGGVSIEDPRTRIGGAGHRARYRRGSPRAVRLLPVFALGLLMPRKANTPMKTSAHLNGSTRAKNSDSDSMKLWNTAWQGVGNSRESAWKSSPRCRGRVHLSRQPSHHSSKAG